jgi:hypothetical protein
MPRADATFIQPTLITNALANVGGASPATGSKWIVRHIHFSNTSAGAVAVTFSIGAGTATTEILAAVSIPANSVLDMYGVYEIPAATNFQGLASVTNVVNVTVSGTLNTP